MSSNPRPTVETCDVRSETTASFSENDVGDRLNTTRAVYDELPALETLSLGPDDRLVGVSHDRTITRGPSGNLYKIPQTHARADCNLNISNLPLAVIFNPESDELILRNRDRHDLFYIQALAPLEACEEQTPILPREYAILPPGAWRLLDHQQQRRLDFHWRPRTFRASLRPAQALGAPSSGAGALKREAPDDHANVGALVDAKKMRTAEDSCMPEGPFRVAAMLQDHSPVASTAGPAIENPATDTLAPATSDEIQATAPGNALLHLPLRQAMSIGSGGVEKYVLTKQHAIADQSAAQVFAALQMGLPLSGQRRKQEVVPELIVVKVLKAREDDASGVRKAAEDWQKEFGIHKALDHPSIVRLYGGDGRFLSLYMEHVAGTDLSGMNSNAQFVGRPEDAFRIAHDCAAALLYIHEQGYRHNDIKPANILWDGTRAVVCDFGIACKSGVEWGNCGTSGYLAFELRDGDNDEKASGALDVWALGITLLYVLGEMELPELRADGLASWSVAEMRKDKKDEDKKKGLQNEALQKMKDWLKKVNGIKNQMMQTTGLSEDEQQLRGVVLDMLEEDPARRITMREAVEELASLV